MSIKKISDEKLFDFVKEGDRRAYEELYDRYKRPLVAYALKKMNEDEAYDLIHDLWLRIWEKRETLDIKGTVVSYLFKAVRNRIIDFMAKSAHSQRYLASVELEGSSLGGDKADYQLREKMFMKQIEQVLNKYSDKAHSIVRLRMQGYNNHEIAEKLNLSEKTIRNQHSSILKFLKAKFPYMLLFILLIMMK
ncbi:RNA polymerase sigma factor [Sphingobacterium sp. SYP-B4668]|uniref:RNA polymerase sigma factor n=1 Tax=Sphingobacterium sp. SYP-B4668 TaxID=2996035 RepID=UPI0022DDF406|nr:sigma-70 family RNA polymerase sigma factor [Sphingobacterium sp. SYP-B4668]